MENSIFEAVKFSGELTFFVCGNTFSEKKVIMHVT